MRLLRLIVLVAVLGFVGQVVLGAQTLPVSPGFVGELQALPLIPTNPSTSGRNCGKYFGFSGVPSTPGKVGMVFFVVSKGTPNDIAIPVIASDKLEIRVIVGQKVPKIKVLRSGGPVYPWFEISLSQQDFDQAPCLAYSKLVV